MKVEEDASRQAERQLLELLRHVATGASEDHRRKRIRGLDDLQTRIESGCLFDEEEATNILLELARKHGDRSPEGSTVVDLLLALIDRNAAHYERILSSLEATKEEKERIFLVFSKLVLKLDYNKKKEAIRPLVCFLTTSDSLNRVATKEVYDCLVNLGNQRLSNDIIQTVAPHLDSIDLCPVVFSVQLVSKFAGQEYLEKMLYVLERSLKGYFDGNNVIIEREICEFIRRVDGLQDSKPLLDLIAKRSSQNPYDASRALASLLDSRPSCIDDVLSRLWEERDITTIDFILKAFDEMERKLTRKDLTKLLQNTRVEWWTKYPLPDTLTRLLVKNGKESKPLLFEMLKQSEKYNFALDCLKKIGFSKEELSGVFSQPIMIQLYNYFYKNQRELKDLNTIWKEKEKLSNLVPGKTNRLEHLLVHIFLGFNLLVLNVAPLKQVGVDLVCFNNETLDILVVGCTTGTLKDDLTKMDEAVKRLKTDIPDLPKLTSITPIVVVTSNASVSRSDEQYSSDNNIIILQNSNIDALLDMLITNRKTSDMLTYIKNQRKFASAIESL